MQDFIQSVVQNLGVDQGTASKATGGALQLLKQHTDGADFSALLDKLPGAADLLKAAPALSGGGEGGGGMLGGMLGKAASALGGGGGKWEDSVAGALNPADTVEASMDAVSIWLPSKYFSGPRAQPFE